jgi:hypothetical protein
MKKMTAKKPKNMPKMKKPSAKGNPKDPAGAEHFMGSKGHITPGMKGSQKPLMGKSPKAKASPTIKGTPPSSSKPGVRVAKSIGNDKAKGKGEVRNRAEKNPHKKKK